MSSFFTLGKMGDPHLGDLARLPDAVLFSIMTGLEGSELLHGTMRVSWTLHNLSNSEELWRRLVLLYHIDPVHRIATFCFKGTWKLTYFKPKRDLVEIEMTNDKANTNTNLLGGERMTELVEDYKLQNRRVVRKHQAPPAAVDQETTDLFHGRALGEVTSWDRLPRSYSINHTQGIRQPPPYSTLRPRESFVTYNVLGTDFLAWPMNLKGVDRRHKLSQEEFQNEFELPNKPVILTGMTETWAARKKWQPDNFAKEFKDRTFKSSTRATDGKSFEWTGFDFLSYCNSCNGEKPFYLFHSLTEEKEEETESI